MVKTKYKTLLKENDKFYLKEFEGNLVKIKGKEFFHYKNENGLNFIIDMKVGVSLCKGYKTKKEAVEKSENMFEAYLKKTSTKEYNDLIIAYNKYCERDS